MINRSKSRISRFLAIALYSLVLVALTGGSASAAQSCQKISGKFTLQPITGVDCTSPVGLCAAATYKGDLAGTNTFIASSILQSIDTPTTGVILVTGDGELVAKDGTLLVKEALSYRTVGRGTFAGVSTILGGTGSWAGVTGDFTTAGTLAADGGEGEYSGEVCYP